MSKGFTLMVISLHDDLAGHLRVNRAEVGVGSCFAESEGKLFVGIQHFGFEHFVRAHHRVGNIVAVGPSDGSSHRHRQVPRAKAKLLIFTSVGAAFCCALAVKLLEPAPSPAIASPNAANRTAPDTLLLMFFYLSFIYKSLELFFMLRRLLRER